jgi:DnaJ-class molecular chaperone
MAKPCSACHGSGQLTCKTCGGGGSYAGDPAVIEAVLQPCPTCKGTCKTPCATCEGTGTVA